MLGWIRRKRDARKIAKMLEAREQTIEQLSKGLKLPTSEVAAILQEMENSKTITSTWKNWGYNKRTKRTTMKRVYCLERHSKRQTNRSPVVSTNMNKAHATFRTTHRDQEYEKTVPLQCLL